MTCRLGGGGVLRAEAAFERRRRFLIRTGDTSWGAEDIPTRDPEWRAINQDLVESLLLLPEAYALYPADSGPIPAFKG